MIKLLAIYDNKDNLTVLKAVIKDAFPDSILFTSQNGPGGFELAIAKDPDVILLDIVTPGMEGYDICKILKSNPKTKYIPIIMVTAIKTDAENRIKGLKIGADAFLSKPIDKSELSAQINMMLRIKSAEDKLRQEKVILEVLVDERTKELTDSYEDLKLEVAIRKKAQNALQESEAKYRNQANFLNVVTENSPFAMWVSDAEGIMIRANQALRNILNLSDDMIIGKYNVLHDENLTAQGFLPAVEAVFKDLKSTRFTMFWVGSKAGDVDLSSANELWIDVSMFPIQDDAGKLVNVVCQYIDITERKQAEKKLIESLSRSEVLFEHAAIPIWEEDFSEVKKYIDNLRNDGVVDLESYLYDRIDEVQKLASLVSIRMVNKKNLEFYEVNDLSELSRNLTDWFSEESLHVFRDEIVSLANGAEKYENEILVHKPNGESKYLLLNLSILPDNREPWDRIFVSFIDVTDRKIAEKALGESEEYFRTLIENSSDVISILDDKGIITYESPSHEKVLGYETGKLIGENVFGLVHPDDRERISRQFAQLLKRSNGIEQVNFRFLHQNGTWIYIEGTGTNLLNSSKIKGIVVNYRDITDRKQAELEIVRAQKKAEESENYLDNIINNMGDPVFVKDDQSRILLANNAFCDIFGLPISAIIGKTLAEDVPPEEQESFLKIDKQVLADGIENINEETLTVRDGNTYIISTKKTRFIDNNGKKFLIGIIRDITELKRTEKLLKESEKLFKDVTFSMADLVWEVDKDGRYTYTSENVEKILGFRSDELIGKTPFDFMQEDEAKRVGELFKEIISLNNPIKDLENWNLSRDGELVCLLTNAIPLFDSSDELVGYRGVDKDITERKLAEEAQVQSTKRLIQAQRIAKMGDFTWDVTTGEVSWSDSLFYLLKYDKTEKIDFAKVNKDIHYPDDLLELSAWLNEGIASGEEKLLPKEYRLICKDGEVIYVRTQGIIERKEGKSVKLIATLFDITERKQAELDLLESEEYFRTLIENSSDVISILDDKGIITYESPSHERVLGYETGKLIGENVFGLVHPDDRERISGQFVKLLKRSNGIEQVNFRVLHKNGTWIYIEGTGTNLLNSSKIKGIVVNYRDISERKQAEELLKQRMDDLEIFNDAAVDREIAINDLRKEINELLVKVGKEEKYEIVE